MQDTVYDVLIIGAGASGLICARECAQKGLRTLLVEKESLPGRKISASGNGRCNFTNRHVAPCHYYGDEKFLTNILQQFPFEKCLSYFRDLGISVQEEENGRFFPSTGKSTAILEPLKLAVLESGAELRTQCEIVRIRKGNPFTAYTQHDEKIATRHIVLACGSCAYPQLSGTNSGYQLARQLGHTVIPARPSLSALCLKEKSCARLAGIRVQARLDVWDKEQSVDAYEGEILFTSYGLSGPAALNVSGSISRLIDKGEVHVTLDLFPKEDDLPSLLARRLTQFGTRKPKDFFAGLLHENITNLLIDYIGLRKTQPMKEQPPHLIQQLSRTLKQWPLTVLSLRPWSEAMVALGGVKLHEINYNTLESLRCPHVFITGELLDIAGKSGGFNLHFAWASGFIAARHLSEKE